MQRAAFRAFLLRAAYREKAFRACDEDRRVGFAAGIHKELCAFEAVSWVPTVNHCYEPLTSLQRIAEMC